MAIRSEFGFWATLVLVAFLPTLGCDAQQAAPEGARPAESAVPADDHDHVHADDEHAHSHEDEHAEEHAHEHSHDHADHEHEHPETYAAAVARLDQLRGVVEAASKGDDLAKADDDVHEIGHLLEDLDKLAEKETFGDDVKAEIKQAAEDLMDAFEQVDARIHGDEGKAYSDVAEKINAAVSLLKSRVNEEK